MAELVFAGDLKSPVQLDMQVRVLSGVQKTIMTTIETNTFFIVDKLITKGSDLGMKFKEITMTGVLIREFTEIKSGKEIFQESLLIKNPKNKDISEGWLLISEWSEYPNLKIIEIQTEDNYKIKIRCAINTNNYYSFIPREYFTEFKIYTPISLLDCKKINQ